MSNSLPPAPPDSGDVQATAIPQLTFWQKPAVQQIMPLLTSFGFHIALILLIIVTLPVIQEVTKTITEQAFVPTAELTEGADDAGVPNPGVNNDPSRQAEQDVDPSVTDSKDWGEKKSDTLSAVMATGSAETNTSATAIGAGVSTGGAVTGLNTAGLGEGGASGLAKYGTPGGGGGGLQKGLFPGASGRKGASRVAILCDASGSMAGIKQDLLLEQLTQVVDTLKSSQQFNIVFFQDVNAKPLFTDKLEFATPGNKSLAMKFIEEYQVRSSTDPVPAIKLITAHKPQLVFILTDGMFSEPEKVEAAVKELIATNPGTKVNTVLLINVEGTDIREAKTAEDLLQNLAKIGGGDFKRFTTDDLQKDR
jgi:hypothetical protein